MVTAQDRVAATSARLLQRRLHSVVASYSKPELTCLFDELDRCGEVVLFGGVLRDLSLEAPRAFKSDIDVVVAECNERELARVACTYNATTNRFGGHRIALKRGSVDLWPLSRTWAFQVGALSGNRPEDLIKTTFFSWDAIAYVWHSRQLVAGEKYFEQTCARVVDLQFPDNPNPLGLLVRTLRIVATGKAALTMRLARFTLMKLERHTVGQILAAERRGFACAYLTAELVSRIQRALSDYLLYSSEHVPFRMATAEQLGFTFVRDASAQEAGKPSSTLDVPFLPNAAV
jgi:hypothetical protein